MPEPVVFAFEDIRLSTWLVLNKAGDAYHWIHPVAEGDQRVTDNLVPEGTLVCECLGGRYRATCWAVVAVNQRLAQLEADLMDPSLGAGAAVEAYRG